MRQAGRRPPSRRVCTIEADVEAAGGFEAATGYHDIAAGPGWTATVLATVVSLVVAYVVIAWLLRFVQHHPISDFIGYRVALAALVAAYLVITGNA